MRALTISLSLWLCLYPTLFRVWHPFWTAGSTEEVFYTIQNCLFPLHTSKGDCKRHLRPTSLQQPFNSIHCTCNGDQAVRKRLLTAVSCYNACIRAYNKIFKKSHEKIRTDFTGDQTESNDSLYQTSFKTPSGYFSALHFGN